LYSYGNASPAARSGLFPRCGEAKLPAFGRAGRQAAVPTTRHRAVPPQGHAPGPRTPPEDATEHAEKTF